MRLRYAIQILSTVILLTAGCSFISGTAAEAVNTPTATTSTATPTEIVWFPPTNTPVIAAAVTLPPTPERKPGVGELLVADKMTSTVHWNAATRGEASVIVSDRGLTVSARPGEPPVSTLYRSVVFGDMFLEITARPSLCKGRDAYGLVFRAPNEVASYRLVAVCDGAAAVERVSLGTPRVLQPPLATSDVPIGAPGEVRLGVWALNSEFRFFLNDRFQFTVTDPSYRTGGIGVFVEARGETPAVVTFSDLNVYQLLPSATTVTPTP